MREFDLGDILSITTERLVSRRHIDGVYDILNHMTGDNLFTHQLPRASRQCRPALLAQHPDLAEIEVPEREWTQESMAVWLDELSETYGRTRPVQILAESEYIHVDPIEELADMVGPEKVFVMRAPGERGHE